MQDFGALPSRRPSTSASPTRSGSRRHPFEVDGLTCPCGRRLVVHAVVQPHASLDVLDSLERSKHRQPRAPPLAS